jgi:hypothetical protein
MPVYCTVPFRTIQIGGDQQSGWLPANASTPLATPTREVQMQFSITDDGGSNFLLISESEDQSIHNDTWRQTMQEAKSVAAESFGISLDSWLEA